MTYEELKKIASPHIRETEKLPSNSLLLLAQLHIPYKTEKQCEDDFKERISPLKSTPAFLYIDSDGDRILYFSTNTQYYNFYIFHEIAHYLLGHEQNSPQNEIDADMLACILAAPIENLPSTLKSARDLSVTCQIPIDKAEMYWQEIKYKRPKHYRKLLFSGIFLFVFILIIVAFSMFNDHATIDTEIPLTTTDIQTSVPLSDNSTYYITSSGTHYHRTGCQYIKYKTNVISITFDEVKTLNLEPCEECIQ